MSDFLEDGELLDNENQSKVLEGDSDNTQGPQEETERGSQNQENSGKDGGYVETDDPKVLERINRLTREKHEAARKAKELEKRLQELEKERAPKLTEVPEPDIGLAITDQQAYSKLKSEREEYLRQQAIQQFQAEQAQKEKAALEQQRINTLVTAYTEKAKELGVSDSDLRVAGDYVGQSLSHNQELVELILEHDAGPRITVELAKNPELLAEIAELSPLKAAARIERLAQKKSAPPPAPKIPSVRGSGHGKEPNVELI